MNPIVLAALLTPFLLAGCGLSRSGHQTVAERETTTVERPAFAPDGTGYVEVTKTVRVRDEATQADSTTDVRAPEVGTVVAAVAGVATGGVGAGLATALTGLGGTAITALALYLSKRGQVNDLKRDVAYHKGDAAEGWAKVDATRPPG